MTDAQPLLRKGLNPLQEALALYQKGDHSQAERLCRPLVDSNPTSAPLLQFLGILCNRQGKFGEADGLFSQAIELEPNSGEAHFNRGSNLIDLERYADAVTSLERAAALRPNNADTHTMLGLALFKLERVEDAEAQIRRALRLNPNSPDARHTMGAIFTVFDRAAEAIYCYRQALALGHRNPGAVHYDIGLTLLSLQKHSEAAASFTTALKLRPRSAATHLWLGCALTSLNRDDEAEQHFEAALELEPDNAEALLRLVASRRAACDWRGLPEIQRKIIAAFERSSPLVEATITLLNVVDDPALHLNASRKRAEHLARRMRSKVPERARADRGRIRLGYMSADFHAHATAMLAAGLFEQHDRKRFEIYALACGPDDGSEMRLRLRSAFDKFIDVRELSPVRVRDLLRELEIDLAIDLNGYTNFRNSAALVARPAPIQVSYLGYPGTLGADWIDYAIVDRFIVPTEQAHHFTEKLVYLPDCYQVNDSKRAPLGTAPARADFGLPHAGFVFCCFNNPYKLDPDVFQVWMRLLNAVPGSVLWLYQPREQVAANLRREANDRGVDANRLIFAPKLPVAEHIARQQRADLFLDTLPTNAHTTASDALWAGLPILTCAGRSFTSRVAGSLLTCIGLPELVTTSLAEYESLALRLATDPAFYGDIRAKLERNRLASPLFDTERFCRNLEAAYEGMWARWLAGEPPRSFAARPV